jgi:hypothetical protein
MTLGVEGFPRRGLYGHYVPFRPIGSEEVNLMTVPPMGKSALGPHPKDPARSLSIVHGGQISNSHSASMFAELLR